MTPDEYREALQAYVDRRWPTAGIEVRVQVWHPAGLCPMCGMELERTYSDTGQPAGLYHRVLDLGGYPVRQPHYSINCETWEQ